MTTLNQSPKDPSFVQDPYPFYQRARQTGDFVYWSDYEAWAATTHASVSTVLRDRRFGRVNPTLTVPAALADFYAVEAHSMLELDPPHHTRLRGLVLRAFTSRRIAGLAPEIEQLCHVLIDAFPTGDFDLLTHYAQKLPVIIIARLLGVPETLSDQLLSWSNAMVRVYMARHSADDARAANDAAIAFSDFLRGYIETRRDTPADDLISHLIAAEEDGERLSTDELITTCILLLNAGHEATVHTLGNGVKLMLENGVCPTDDINPLVEEILRYDPPLHIFSRWAREDISLLGQGFKAGDRIDCLLASANRDPAIWDDAETFDPSRKATANTSFGGGLHFCVGAPLARLELQIALGVLFDRCPALAVSGTPRYADAYHFHGLTDLMVTR